MSTTPERLRREIATLRDTAAARERDLAEVYANCRHDWIVTPDHIYHESYTIPGDAPGTMGVDWRGPCHVPASTEKRWKRECRICGKVEHTSATNTETVVNETPRFAP